MRRPNARKRAPRTSAKNSNRAAAARPLAVCDTTKVQDDEAANAISDASLAGAATGFGLAGGLGLAIALFYTCLWAMRTGLLGRFWGFARDGPRRRRPARLLVQFCR